MSDVHVNVSDLYPVVDFMAALGTGIEKSLKDDGKITLRDLPNLFPVVMSALPAINNASQIAIFLKAGNPEEMEALLAYVNKTVILDNKSAQEFIEDAFRVVMEIWMFVNKHFLKGAIAVTPVVQG